MCRNVYRGPNIGHTAKARFAVCYENRHTAKFQHTANKRYAVRLAKRPTANPGHTANHVLCRVTKIRHTAKMAVSDVVC